MVLRRLESISLDSFACLDDRDDEECGVFRGDIDTDEITGDIVCLICGAIAGKAEEEPDGVSGGGDDEETSDEDYQDDGDENTGDTGDTDVVTEWDAEKKKLESEKTALNNLSDLLIKSNRVEAKNFSEIIRSEYTNIMSIHRILTTATFYSPRMYKKKMMLCSSLIFAISDRGYKLDSVVVSEAGENINQIRPIVLEGIRKVKGVDEGAVQTWMRVHGESAGIPKATVEQGIEYFRTAEPRMVVADDEIKALAWLILTARTSGYALTMKKLQDISGRSRQSIGRVVKAYAPYFEEHNV